MHVFCPHPVTLPRESYRRGVCDVFLTKVDCTYGACHQVTLCAIILFEGCLCVLYDPILANFIGGVATYACRVSQSSS